MHWELRQLLFILGRAVQNEAPCQERASLVGLFLQKTFFLDALISLRSSDCCQPANGKVQQGHPRAAVGLVTGGRLSQ